MLNGITITALCANSVLLPSNACSPTSEALVRQVGLYENVGLLENYLINRARLLTPSEVVTLAGYAAPVYRFYSGQEVRFGFKIPDYCDRVEIGGSKSVQHLSIKWNF
jgi:hypothetical protein